MGHANEDHIYNKAYQAIEALLVAHFEALEQREARGYLSEHSPEVESVHALVDECDCQLLRPTIGRRRRESRSRRISRENAGNLQLDLVGLDVPHEGQRDDGAVRSSVVLEDLRIQCGDLKSARCYRTRGRADTVNAGRRGNSRDASRHQGTP